MGLKELGLLGDMSFSVGLIDTVGALEAGGDVRPVSVGDSRPPLEQADELHETTSATTADVASFPAKAAGGITGRLLPTRVSSAKGDDKGGGSHGGR